MSRPPTILVEKKLRIVLSMLQGEIPIAEAARREKVSEQTIGNWKRQFLPDSAKQTPMPPAQQTPKDALTTRSSRSATP